MKSLYENYEGKTTFCYYMRNTAMVAKVFSYGAAAFGSLVACVNGNNKLWGASVVLLVATMIFRGFEKSFDSDFVRFSIDKLNIIRGHQR